MAKKKGNRRARIRRRVRKIKKRASTGISNQWGKISNLVGGVVFLAQITSKDRRFYGGKSKGDQIKQLINNVLGRAVGINPFDDQQKFSQTINVDGIFNKYTGAGLAGIAYGLIPIKGLPHKAKVKRLSKSIFTGGLIGGLLDGIEGDTRNRVQSQRGSPQVMISGQVTTA